MPQIKEESIKKNRQIELEKYNKELLYDMAKFSNRREPKYIELNKKYQSINNESLSE